MALLQISEPGLAPAPHERRLAVGIDLGTTHSLVAAVRNGVSEVLPDLDGALLLPSVVRYLATGKLQLGRLAKEQAALDPKNTIVSVKRLMGRGKAEIENTAHVPYDLVAAPGMVQIKTIAGVKSPVEVSAEILAALQQRAQASLGGELVGAVITVPAYFDEAQRQATKDAAELAGLNVLRLLNEPTAAAIAYGLESGAQGIYAVYDLGGGTFDLSILQLTQGVFEVLATGGDSMLGGDDFDQALLDYVLAKAAPETQTKAAPETQTKAAPETQTKAAPETQTKAAPETQTKAALETQTKATLETQALTAGDRRLLLDAARSAKEALSSAPQTCIDLLLSNGLRIAVTVSEAEFAELVQPLVQRTLVTMRKTLRDAQIAAKDVQGIVLVGGATRMPVVRRAVELFFAQPVLTGIDPDQVVALGAAIQADLLAGNRRDEDDWLLLDVIPLSLGVETMGGLVEKIIPRNSAIPVARAQEFTTFKDGQTAMSIHVVQGERELVADCRSLARFELRGIPPMTAGAARIQVSYQVDADGLLSVLARELQSGVAASVVVKPSYGLSDEEIGRMLDDSFQAAKIDKYARALRELQVDAERLLAATASALARDADLLSASERATIDTATQALQEVKNGAHSDVLERAIEVLAAATDEFAARRMNQNIRTALAGRKVDELTEQ